MKSVIRRWRLILVAVAFAFSFAEQMAVRLIETYPDFVLSRAYLRATGFPRASICGRDGVNVFAQLLLILVLAIEINWPYFVLAASVRRIVLKHWPNAIIARAAMIGGLMGLVIPSVPLYALLPLDDIANLCVHRGAGASFLVLVFWPIAGLLCYIGLKLGPLALRLRERS